MSRTCGDCTACCKILGVEELDKPAGTQCVHCDPGKGCKIYEQRPATCREFACTWLQHGNLPDELRPDRCHVVFWNPEDNQSLMMGMEDEHHPGAHDKGMALRFIMHMAHHGCRVEVIAGDQKHTFVRQEISDGTERPLS